MVEVVALARALADAGEHRQARVLLGDVVDELHHVHGLADAGAAEQTDLAALGERANQIDDLDAGLEQFGRGLEVLHAGRLLVDRAPLVGGDRTRFVDWAAEHVHDAAERRGADRHGDGIAGVVNLHAAAQTVGGAERNRADDAVTKLLLHFEREAGFDARMLLALVEHQCVVDARHGRAGELDVHHGADALNDIALGSAHRFSPVVSCEFNSMLSGGIGGKTRGLRRQRHRLRSRRVPS